MTIESFEEEVRKVFVSKGWDLFNTQSGLTEASWFTISYGSYYKLKSIYIIRQVFRTEIVSPIENKAETWEECFEITLKLLKGVR